MKKENLIQWLLLALFNLSLVSCSKRISSTTSFVDKTNKKAAAIVASADSNKYKLVWSDEFNYTGLPNPDKWEYEVGYARGPLLQYYTKARAENAYVQNGNLELTAIKEEYPNAEYVRGSTDWRKKDSLAHYTGASITTQGKAAWQYGRIEVRAKMPQGNGMWPAIWMMGANHPTVRWPKCGEVDILEYFGNSPAKLTSNFYYANAAGSRVTSNWGSLNVYYPYNDFSVYRLDWDEAAMTISVDGKHVTTLPLNKADFNGDNAFRKPFFMLLSNQIGGWAGTPRGTVDDTKLPGKFIIDYVRVYRRSER